MSKQTKAKRSQKRAGVLAAAGLVSIALGACAPDRVITTNSIPNDYRARHPIALTQAPIATDVIPAGDRIDAVAGERIRAFGKEYVANGQGPISVQVPTTSRSHAIIDGVRRELAAAGVHGNISVSSYQPADPTLVSPVRLSYIGTKAIVRSRCGDWPRDLASGSSLEGWDNNPYWNHGCAYQQAIAAQVADPRDLAAPRAEGPSDVTMRTRAIGKVREGADPGTQWSIENTSIGVAGAN